MTNELKPTRIPFKDWEVRARYSPEKGIKQIWVNVYIGPVSACPDVTVETVIALRGLIDDLEDLLRRKAAWEAAMVALEAPRALEVNSPEEDAAMDLLQPPTPPHAREGGSDE